MFTVLLSFISFLARLANVRTKFLTLNDELCMVRPSLIDLNPVKLKYYPFMKSLDKCTGICILLSQKDLNIKAFNMIINKNEAKAMTKHISCDCKFKFNSTICNSNQKLNK